MMEANVGRIAFDAGVEALGGSQQYMYALHHFCLDASARLEQVQLLHSPMSKSPAHLACLLTHLVAPAERLRLDGFTESMRAAVVDGGQGVDWDAFVVFCHELRDLNALVFQVRTQIRTNRGREKRTEDAELFFSV
jgi:hypothetical protein